MLESFLGKRGMGTGDLLANAVSSQARGWRRDISRSSQCFC